MRSNVLAVFGGFGGEHAMPSTTASRWIEVCARIRDERAESWDASCTAETRGEQFGGRWEQEGAAVPSSELIAGWRAGASVFLAMHKGMRCCRPAASPLASISPCPARQFCSACLFLSHLDSLPVSPRVSSRVLSPFRLPIPTNNLPTSRVPDSSLSRVVQIGLPGSLLFRS